MSRLVKARPWFADHCTTDVWSLWHKVHFQILIVFLAVILDRSCLVAADTILVGITWWQLLRQSTFRAGLWGRHMTFADIVLRDGR